VSWPGHAKGSWRSCYVFLAKIRTISKTIIELKITSMYHQHTFVVSKCMMWYTVVVLGSVLVLGVCNSLIQAYSLDFMFNTKCHEGMF
jgi:hypothetical protein